MSKAVVFSKVSKSYVKIKGKYGLLTDVISEKLFGLNKTKIKSDNIVKALDNVSFEIKEGEAVGIIGRNGAGKSTILKLISRITYPDKGYVRASGRIGAFIELGAGLHIELTGRENIYMYGAILGMRKNEIDKKFNSIVDFSGIEKFLDVPIKRYSTGMYSRLGFSVCAFCDPDLLLVDEVLAVGDEEFQRKCLKKMHSFAKEKTVVFVSHNLQAIKSICSKVIYLDRGKIAKAGKPDEIIK